MNLKVRNGAEFFPRWQEIVDALEQAGVPLDDMTIGALILGTQSIREELARQGIRFEVQEVPQSENTTVH